jgi:serine/threonine protein phosphatase PrpC
VNWEDVIVEAAATDTGMRRANNQDSHVIVRAPTAEIWKQRGHLFMVADGMGAHAVGELASKLACDNIPHNYKKSKNGTPAEALIKAYREVGAYIHGKASANKDFQGMGTTCSTLILLPAGALIAHVGDSRVYRVRNDRIDQLSFDHSLVWELIRRNHLTPEQAGKTVPKNVITRSLGPDPTVEVDLEGPMPVELGDVYVLCSDGLSGPVTDPEIGTFAASFPPQVACRYLIHLANLRGGLDNITVIVLRIGPWVEPGTTEMAIPGASQPRKSRGSLFSGLIGSLGRKPPPPVEEHIYQSASSLITEAMLDQVAESIRHGQAVAVEQSWSVDWPTLANLLKDVQAARTVGDFQRALRFLGEALTLLGQAARHHRKHNGG